MLATAILRAQAQAKRELANVVRQVGITLSIAGDRELMGRYAEQLEKEASELETRADTDAIATAVEAPGD